MFEWLKFIQGPKFKLMEFVIIPTDHDLNSKHRYMQIRVRRWSDLERQWIYDGPTVIPTNNELIGSSSNTGLAGIPESKITRIPNFWYSPPTQGLRRKYR